VNHLVLVPEQTLQMSQKVGGIHLPCVILLTMIASWAHHETRSS
jgi:hypothetical protein